ncbi:hypothetical protein ASG51_02595 [Methylobacterium sp. Leaf465]|nr:hypothetical protein ASG51_02595 [Methylobacterium sp. Leaf465]
MRHPRFDIPVINLTDGLIVVGKTEQLQTQFAQRVQEAAEIDIARGRRGEITTRVSTMLRIRKQLLAAAKVMSVHEFIDAFLMLDRLDTNNPPKEKLRKVESALRIPPMAQKTRGVITLWFKYAYFMMWSDGLVRLPLTFRLRTDVWNEQFRKLAPALATCQFDNPDAQSSTLGLSLVLASGWRSFSDIDLDLFGPSTMEVVRKIRSGGLPGVRDSQPSTAILAALAHIAKSGQGHGFAYSLDDIRSYRYWVHLHLRGVGDMTPSELLADPESVRRAQASVPNQAYARRLAAAQLDLIDDENREDFRHAVLDGEKVLQDVKFELLANKVNAPEDILVYMKALRMRGTFRNKGNPYPTRMHAFPVDLWSTWSSALDEFFAHRVRQGYESLGKAETRRHLIQDYLCCYLPWWIELHPGLDVSLPTDPSQFTRFGNWVEGMENGAAPVPLLDFYRDIRMSKGDNGLNAFISFAFRFFEFCRAQAPKLNFSRQDFVNPVMPEFDRNISRSPQKTNKTPIPKALMPFILRYAYACESFFIEISNQILAGKLTKSDVKGIWRRVRKSEAFKASEYGLNVTFEYDGNSYTISEVPQLATWAERSVKLGAQEVSKVVLPHLSSLRMIIVALETGIRFQGVQWLCKKAFHRLAAGNMAGAELMPLQVNTDKVRDRPWNTLIVRRAFEVLMREAAFQDQMVDDFQEVAVQYERREYTRFAPVFPLFRSPYQEYPVSNQAYTTTWDRFLVSFCLWHRRALNSQASNGMWRYVPEMDPLTGMPKVVMHLDGEESRPCSPIKVRLKHTPHSARSTFITSRSGVLPIEITGWLVGHTNTATTYHYTVENQEQVGARVLAASNSVWEPDPENPVHIRADNANSALRKSFQADRVRTEAAFGLQTLSLLNEDLQDVDGIMRLRSTPMSQVIFRETHICPVGEMCPSDVMDVIVEPRRCGVCPLAVKSVDHLPSIGAKMRQLLEQVREGGRLVERLKAKSEPDATVDAVQHRRRLDATEYEGWRTSLLALTRSLDELGHASVDLFHVGMPDAVRLHLRMVTRDASMAEFILHRLTDASGHPGFETPVLRAQAIQLRQRLLASMRAIEAEIELYEVDPVRAFVSGLHLALKAHGIAPTFASALEAVSSVSSLAGTGASPRLAAPPEE